MIGASLVTPPEMLHWITAGEIVQQLANVAVVEVLAPQDPDNLRSRVDALFDAEGDASYRLVVPVEALTGRAKVLEIAVKSIEVETCLVIGGHWKILSKGGGPHARDARPG